MHKVKRTREGLIEHKWIVDVPTRVVAQSAVHVHVFSQEPVLVIILFFSSGSVSQRASYRDFQMYGSVCVYHIACRTAR